MIIQNVIAAMFYILIVVTFILMNNNNSEINKIKKNWKIAKNAAEIVFSQVETRNRNNLFIYGHVYASGYQTPEYRSVIEYKYKINGKEYYNSQVQYNQPWLSSLVTANRLVRLYKTGTTVDLIYNPQNPSQTFLLMPYESNFTYYICMILFLLLALYFTYIKQLKN
jgi:hypothetical protein